MLPTHRVEHWNDSTWTKSSLKSLGYVFHLGHHGHMCDYNAEDAEGADSAYNADNADKADNTNDDKDDDDDEDNDNDEDADSVDTSGILVGDTNGFHWVDVCYCTHPGALSKALQLLYAGIFPCSDIQPRSGFTIPLLSIFNTFLMLGRTSAHKFYSVLEHQTNPGFPGDVKDRYRQLMATHRKYLYLLNLQRSGERFEPHTTDVHPGDQALDCVACPRPGVNFLWDEVSPDEHAWFRSHVSYDGNFRSVRKSKKVEDGDLCFSNGKAYFPPKAAYKEWTETQVGPQREEKPACDHHKAASDSSIQAVGRDVTGIGSLTCTSHSCFVPRGTVDFFKGERFIYADYALASAVTHMTRGPKLSFGLTYDIWCHWVTNWQKRMLNLPDSIALPSDFDLVGAIPKWHLVGHDPSCYVRYSLDNMAHVGRMEGEGPERVWAHLNQHSGSTSEQGPGVRTDTINNLAYEWNFEKMIRLHKQLLTKFREGTRMYLEQKARHLQINASLPPAEVRVWQSMSTEATYLNGRWTSPLMDPVWTSGSFRTTISTESAKESQTSRIARKRPGATRWISDGIELEHEMQKMQEEMAAAGANPTPRQAESSNKRRLNICDRCVEHQKQRPQFMLALTERKSNHPDCRISSDGEYETWDLALPSYYNSPTLSNSGLVSMASLEKDLRRAICDDALSALRQLLGARAFTIKYKQQHVRGQVPTSQSESTIREHTTKIAKARWRYDNSCDALLRLGSDDPESQRFRPIKNEDLKTLQYFLENESRGVGQGYASISWIWMGSRGEAPNLDQWQVQSLKTEWFRSRERYLRWEEQLVLLKREMTMAIRTFRTREEIWKWKAEAGCSTPGMRSYAMGQSRFYGELACRALNEFGPHLSNNIVKLKWSMLWLEKNVISLEFKKT